MTQPSHDIQNALPQGYQLRNPSGTTYRLLGVLGRGGFGITYLAEYRTMVNGIMATVRMAVKEHFLADSCERDPNGTHTVVCSAPLRVKVANSLRSFLSEARRLMRLGRHANIIGVNDVFEANNTAYYVMDLIEGETLREYVKARGKLDDRETLAVMRPVVEAVGWLHHNLVTHLDIKPDNIMISRDEKGALVPVLIDFGLSKHYTESGSATSTISLAGCSDGYTPMEQYAGITKFSPTADVYALGATMLFCLTGKDPDKADEITEESFKGISSRTLFYAIAQSMSTAKSARPADANVLLDSLKSRDTREIEANGNVESKDELSEKGKGKPVAPSSTVARVTKNLITYSANNRRKLIPYVATICVLAFICIFWLLYQTPASSPSAEAPATLSTLPQDTLRAEQATQNVKPSDTIRPATKKDSIKVIQIAKNELPIKEKEKTESEKASKKKKDDAEPKEKASKAKEKKAEPKSNVDYGSLAEQSLSTRNYEEANKYIAKAFKSKDKSQEEKAKAIRRKMREKGYYDDPKIEYPRTENGN